MVLGKIKRLSPLQRDKLARPAYYKHNVGVLYRMGKNREAYIIKMQPVLDFYFNKLITK